MGNGPVSEPGVLRTGAAEEWRELDVTAAIEATELGV